MSQKDFTVWILKIIIVWAVLFVIQVPLRRKGRPSSRRTVFIIKAVLVPVSAVLFVSIGSRPSFLYADWLTAVYIVLFGGTAADIAEFIIRRIIGRKKDKPEERTVSLKPVGILSAVFCFCVFMYGTANAAHVSVNRHTWKAEGLARAHTFAFASDIHAGNAQSMEVLREFCRQVNAEKPEFVIFGGDITDELTSFDEMVTAYGIFSEIEAPVYFVYGNHDRQPDSDYAGGRTYSDRELADTIQGAGIHILSDEYVQISEDLVLLGREDMSRGGRKNWAELKNPYEGTPLIVADHQPYDKVQLAQEISVLQLSGHTHAGQLWPLQGIYRLIGLPAYGEFEKPGTRLYVSAGESGWALPLRTEEHCEWELITLEP